MVVVLLLNRHCSSAIKPCLSSDASESSTTSLERRAEKYQNIVIVKGISVLCARFFLAGFLLASEV